MPRRPVFFRSRAATVAASVPGRSASWGPAPPLIISLAVCAPTRTTTVRSRLTSHASSPRPSRGMPRLRADLRFRSAMRPLTTMTVREAARPLWTTPRPLALDSGIVRTPGPSRPVTVSSMSFLERPSKVALYGSADRRISLRRPPAASRTAAATGISGTARGMPAATAKARRCSDAGATSSHAAPAAARSARSRFHWAARAEPTAVSRSWCSSQPRPHQNTITAIRGVKTGPSSAPGGCDRRLGQRYPQVARVVAHRQEPARGQVEDRPLVGRRAGHAVGQHEVDDRWLRLSAVASAAAEGIGTGRPAPRARQPGQHHPADQHQNRRDDQAR